MTLLAATALSCTTPPPPPVPWIVVDGYRLFAKRDCTAVRVRARTSDLPEASPEHETFRLLDAYCLELEGRSDEAKELYRSIVARVPIHAMAYEAAVRMIDLERLQRRGTTRAELKRRADQEQGTKSSRYDHDVLPIFRMNPAYPAWLREAGIEGWVIVDFEIAGDGTVIDPIVLDSDPPFVFDSAALGAIRNWIYEPSTEGGSIRHLIRLNFEIDDGPSGPSDGYR
jgi:TonB family protein